MRSTMGDDSELPFDDTAVLVLSERVGNARAATIDNWPPEPPEPAPPPRRHARFYPVVRPPTCSGDAM